MQVLPDAIIINASRSQKGILSDPKYSEYVEGMILNLKKWDRPRIPVSRIPALIKRLRNLQTLIVKDPGYSKRRPAEVIERIILNIEDAAAVQARTYPSKKSNLGPEPASSKC
jgi:hypothetical protein